MESNTDMNNEDRNTSDAGTSDPSGASAGAQAETPRTAALLAKWPNPDKRARELFALSRQLEKDVMYKRNSSELWQQCYEKVNKERDELTQALTASRTEYALASAVCDDLRGQVERLTAECERLTADLTASREEREKLREKLIGASGAMATIASLNKELTANASEIAGLRKDKERLLKIIETQRNRLKNTKRVAPSPRKPQSYEPATIHLNTRRRLVCAGR